MNDIVHILTTTITTTTTTTITTAITTTVMLQMEGMTPAEEGLYNGVNELDVKIAWLQKECQWHINNGNLTKLEKASVLDSLAGKLVDIENKLEAAADNAKKVTKIEAFRDTLLEQIAKTEACAPVKMPIKHASEIAALEATISHIGARIANNSASISEMAEHKSACRCSLNPFQLAASVLPAANFTSPSPLPHCSAHFDPPFGLSF
jgi:hypothetical protein